MNDWFSLPFRLSSSLSISHDQLIPILMMNRHIFSQIPNQINISSHLINIRYVVTSAKNWMKPYENEKKVHSLWCFFARRVESRLWKFNFPLLTSRFTYVTQVVEMEIANLSIFKQECKVDNSPSETFVALNFEKISLTMLQFTYTMLWWISIQFYWLKSSV